MKQRMMYSIWLSIFMLIYVIQMLQISYILNREVNNRGDFPLKFADSGIKYRGYIIHKKIYQSYLLFYIISDENQTVYVLRILKDIMNWRNILQKTNIYHFSSYR